MFEVVGAVVGHSEFFHHSTRSNIGRYGKGDHLGNREFVEREANHFAGCLGREALSPILGGKTPANFNSRDKARLREPDVTDEVSGVEQSNSEQTISVLLQPLLGAINKGIALGACDQGRVEFHDARVTTHGREWFTISFVPVPQTQAAGPKSAEIVHDGKACLSFRRDECFGWGPGQRPRVTENTVLSRTGMSAQEEHEKLENLVDQPGQAAHSARSLGEAADSNHTLEGLFAINDVKDVAELEKEAAEDKSDENREKGHPVP